jgi:putative transposase
MVFETSSGARYQRRLPHFRSPGSVYHVRSSVNPLLGRFNEEWMLEVIEYSVLFGHKKTNLLHAYIIMPNHIHLVIEPLPVTNTWNAWCDYRQFHRLENIVRRLKSYSGRAINKRLKRSGPMWLDEYFDRIIRDDIDLDTVIDYIHHNPVRWGWLNSRNSIVGRPCIPSIQGGSRSQTGSSSNCLRGSDEAVAKRPDICADGLSSPSGP